MKSKDIDALRDIALDLEHTSPKSAISLLELALKYRPHGKFIAAKLNALRTGQQQLQAQGSIDGACFGDVADVLNAGGAVLKLRAAGIGDMLNQCVGFLSVCNLIHCQPYFILPHGGGRNELSTQRLFDLFGFFEAGWIVGSSPSMGLPNMPLSEAAKLLVESEKVGVRLFEYDNNCYSSDSLKAIRKQPFHDSGKTYSRLREVISQGSLYKQVMERRQSEEKRVAVHVRLGDVALIEMKCISHLLKSPDHRGQLMHVRGLFEAAEVDQSLPEGHRSRFKPVEAYAAALDKVLEQHSNASVSLLSDGMTRLAQSMLKRHRELFLNARLSHWQLENELNQWFAPLVDKSDCCLIGEGHGLLEDTMIEGLSSDIIVTGSPGLFRHLSQIMGLKNKFVPVQAQL